MASLRLDGLTAPMVLDGAMNGEAFVAYVRQVLAPTLRPSSVVVLDSLPAHKVKGAREAIEAAGARLLFLLPHSPDFNPVEQACAKIKALLLRPHPGVLDPPSFPPLGHGLDVDAEVPAQRRVRSFRSLYESSDGVCGRGAAAPRD